MRDPRLDDVRARRGAAPQGRRLAVSDVAPAAPAWPTAGGQATCLYRYVSRYSRLAAASVKASSRACTTRPSFPGPRRSCSLALLSSRSVAGVRSWCSRPCSSSSRPASESACSATCLRVGSRIRARSPTAPSATSKRLGAGDPDLVLLVAATDGNVDEPAAAAAGSELTAALATEPHVTQAVSYWSLGGLVALRDDAGDSALVVVDLEGSDDEIDEVISRIDAIYAGERGPITVGVGGPEAVTAAIGEQTATSPDHSTSPPPASSTSPCPS